MDYLGYRNLVVYSKAIDMVTKVYQLLKQYPKEEQFALCNQLRRAAVSVTSNIAEGTTRYSYKEKIHFLELAYGSLMEVMSQLEVSRRLDYISDSDMQSMELLIVEISRLLTNLQYSFMPKDKDGATVKPFQSSQPK